MPLVAIRRDAFNFGKGTLAFVVPSTTFEVADFDFDPPRLFDFSWYLPYLVGVPLSDNWGGAQ